MATVSKTNLSFISGCMGSNKASLAILLVESTGLGVGGGDLPTGLDCPTGVVECDCGAGAVSACRSGTYEPVPANPSYGVTVASEVQTGGCYGWTGGGRCVWRQVDRDTTQFLNLNGGITVKQSFNILVRLVARFLVWWTGVVMLCLMLLFVHNVHHQPLNPGEGWEARCSNLNLHFHLIVTGGNYLLAGRPEEGCRSGRSKCRLWGA